MILKVLRFDFSFHTHTQKHTLTPSHTHEKMLFQYLNLLNSKNIALK
jgi:hypothetical protein